ncbi:MAG: hypothetical protein RL653_2264 [Pseudomonadota bacterium]|jgi:Ca2+/Na+ antiporter
MASPTEPAPESPAAPAQPAPGVPASEGGNALKMALNLWLGAYRVDVLLFAVSFVLLAGFSGERFFRQSAAPHFIYQAQAWLEGRLDIDPGVLPNIEDWACVRPVGDRVERCARPNDPSNRWYVSFPPFPAVFMLPFVAVNGYQLNDTSLGVIVGALAVALFYAFLRLLTREGESVRSEGENAALALLMGFGTLFFYCAIRGEVWFSAEVLGVALTCVYMRNAVKAHRPVLAGFAWSMAVLTRTPLLFTGLFFVLEALFPENKPWGEQWARARENPRPVLRKLGLFAAGAAPLALTGAWFNHVRFGKLSEFGHAFFFNNRVNADIDQYGLFNLHYLGRNLESAFLMLPKVTTQPFRLSYDPNGLSLLLTFPLLLLLLWPREKPRLSRALWLTVAATALPGLLYQNNGYMQFGFRFSLDYTPYLVALVALSGWSLRHRAVVALATLGVLVNTWGASAFTGYTEYVRQREAARSGRGR